MSPLFRVVFNTNRAGHYGTRRLFFDNLASDFRDLGAHVEVDNWQEYEKFDVAILLCQDFFTQTAREKNPNILVGIVHPSDITPALVKETENADFIISGSLEERDYYLKYNPNIFVIHHIEQEWHLYKQHIEKDEVILGYHGNKDHLEQFYPNLAPALEALLKEYPIRLIAVYNIRELGFWEAGRPDIPISDVQWEYHTLGKKLLECDIGLVPSLAPIPESMKVQTFQRLLGVDSEQFGRLPNDYLLRFKNSTNAGRAFVFMQLGIPVVADMTPECCQVLHHARTGFLAHSAAGWYDAIKRLIRSSQLRQEIAENARALFCERFQRKQIAKYLIEQIATLLERKQRGASTPRIHINVLQYEYDSGNTLKSLWQALLHRLREKL